MKANELRIGNWVSYPTTDGSISPTQIELSSFAYDYNASIHIESYLPIPLTKQWLLRFGFERRDAEVFCHAHEDMEETSCYTKGGISILYNHTIAGGVYMLMNYDDLEVRLNHVHQLQNLHFALTGKELTIKQTDENSITN
jgi:hypothetical protein